MVRSELLPAPGELALNRPILIMSGLLGLIGTLLTVNGFFLLFALPI